MSVLEKYKNNEENYEIYRMREDWLRVQSIMERGKRVAEERLAQALVVLEQERAAKEQAVAAREQAEARLRELMARLGISDEN